MHIRIMQKGCAGRRRDNFTVKYLLIIRVDRSNLKPKLRELANKTNGETSCSRHATKRERGGEGGVENGDTVYR